MLYLATWLRICCDLAASIHIFFRRSVNVNLTQIDQNDLYLSLEESVNFLFHTTFVILKKKNKHVDFLSLAFQNIKLINNCREQFSATNVLEPGIMPFMACLITIGVITNGEVRCS